MSFNRVYCILLVLMMCYASPIFAQEAKYCTANTPLSSVKSSPPISLNINSASFEELSTKLKGIGKAKAAAIIEWRETNGKFTSLEDIDEVRGIGPAILEKNRALIRFDD